jgi:hypothetical protein
MRAGWLTALAVMLAACSGGGNRVCLDVSYTCNAGTFTFCANDTPRTVTCKGPRGCEGGRCDTSTHSVGDDCFSDGFFFCDPASGTKALRCTNGKLEVYRTCSGPQKCSISADALRCDATVGDKCPATIEGLYLCDGQVPARIAQCVDGGVVQYAVCQAPALCGRTDAGINCLD